MMNGSVSASISCHCGMTLLVPLVEDQNDKWTSYNFNVPGGWVAEYTNGTWSVRCPKHKGA